MKIHIDENLCAGHGRCYTLAPELLDSNDEGYPTRLGEDIDVTPQLEDAAQRVVANCPEGAIRIL
ncbi:MAG: ferredoxin [Acidimicrobiales bacterium]